MHVDKLGTSIYIELSVSVASYSFHDELRLLDFFFENEWNELEIQWWSAQAHCVYCKVGFRLARKKDHVNLLEHHAKYFINLVGQQNGDEEYSESESSTW